VTCSNLFRALNPLRYPQLLHHHRRDEETARLPVLCHCLSDLCHLHLRRASRFHPTPLDRVRRYMGSSQIVACVVYHFAGQYVASPALGTAGSLIKRVCYGIALPSLIVGGMLFAHTGAKYGTSSPAEPSRAMSIISPLALADAATAFVRILRKSRHLARNTPTHYLVW
jgi:hypothetical protein